MLVHEAKSVHQFVHRKGQAVVEAAWVQDQRLVASSHALLAAALSFGVDGHVIGTLAVRWSECDTGDIFSDVGHRLQHLSPLPFWKSEIPLIFDYSWWPKPADVCQVAMRIGWIFLFSFFSSQQDITFSSLNFNWIFTKRGQGVREEQSQKCYLPEVGMGHSPSDLVNISSGISSMVSPYAWSNIYINFWPSSCHRKTAFLQCCPYYKHNLTILRDVKKNSYRINAMVARDHHDHEVEELDHQNPNPHSSDWVCWPRAVTM